jgi:cation-transporting ATPase E
VQQLNAVESLASVDVACLDKTGTLTDSTLRVVEIVPAPGARPEGALARFAASATARNDTLQAIADSAAAAPQEPEAVVPFASRRRWSGLRLGGTDFVLGAPELFELGALGERADEEARDGRRVVAFGTSPVPLEEIDLDEGPPAFSPLAVILISERLRPEARATVEYFCRERAPRRRQQ